MISEAEHVPGVVYVTVYELAVDAETSISPVPALIVNPAGVDVNAPPAVPVIVAIASVPL